MEKHFQVDWHEVVTISEEMRQVRVPAIRFTPVPGSPWLAVRNVVEIYNALAEKSPQLGYLTVTGDASRRNEHHHHAYP